jgi:hypothetical protein
LRKALQNELHFYGVIVLGLIPQDKSPCGEAKLIATAFVLETGQKLQIALLF